MTIDSEALLSHIAMFEHISHESRRALAGICVPREVKKREALFHEGEEGESLYILARGNIQLFKTTPEGKEVVIKIVKPGELFAEVILFERSRYPVSAVALQNCTVLAISRDRFAILLQAERFRNDFIANLMQKLRFLVDSIHYLTNHDLEERLMLFLREQYGRRERIEIPLTKREVAAAIGTTPETLSRLLHRLKRDGSLIWKGGTILVQDHMWNLK